MPCDDPRITEPAVTGVETSCIHRVRRNLRRFAHHPTCSVAQRDPTRNRATVTIFRLESASSNQTMATSNGTKSNESPTLRGRVSFETRTPTSIEPAATLVQRRLRQPASRRQTAGAAIPTFQRTVSCSCDSPDLAIPCAARIQRDADPFATGGEHNPDARATRPEAKHRGQHRQQTHSNRRGTLEAPQ